MHDRISQQYCAITDFQFVLKTCICELNIMVVVVCRLCIQKTFIKHIGIPVYCEDVC